MLVKAEDIRTQDKPYWIWKRFKTNCKANLNYTLDLGYAYILKHIVLKYANLNTANKKNNLLISLKQYARGRLLNNVPLSSSLYCTPGGSSDDGKEDIKYINAPSPVDDGALNVCSTAGSYIKPIKLNQFYMFKECIVVDMHWENSQPQEEYIDICLFGDLIAEKRLTMWQK